MNTMSPNTGGYAKRGPGRRRAAAIEPAAQEGVATIPEQETRSAPPVKKGNASWKPANVVDVINKEEGFRYRLIRKDDTNIAKKKQEGWELLSGINAQGTDVQAGYGRINDGKKVSSVLEGHDYVVGRIPEDIAKERDAYYNNESDRRTKALYRDAKKDAAQSKGEIHGEITIERKGVRTVIGD